MRINEILAAETPVFSFEFFPPKTEVGEQNLYKALSELRPLEPSFVSVTYGAGGSSREKTIEIVKRIKEDFGLEAMAHFTCVGATVPELRATLDEMQEAGIENVLALRGDPPEGQADWTKTDGGLEYSHELVELIGSAYPFAIGAACFPETHIHADSAESDLRYLTEKVGAGVDFLITQMFFDNSFYFDFVARARRAGVEVPIIPGIMPITSARTLERIVVLSGARFPAAVGDQVRAAGADKAAVREIGTAYAAGMCQRLLDEGAPGLHFFTLNGSVATRDIYQRLGLAERSRAISRGAAGAGPADRTAAGTAAGAAGRAAVGAPPP